MGAGKRLVLASLLVIATATASHAAIDFSLDDPQGSGGGTVTGPSTTYWLMPLDDRNPNEDGAQASGFLTQLFGIFPRGGKTFAVGFLQNIGAAGGFGGAGFGGGGGGIGGPGGQGNGQLTLNDLLALLGNGANGNGTGGNININVINNFVTVCLALCDLHDHGNNNTNGNTDPNNGTPNNGDPNNGTTGDGGNNGAPDSAAVPEPSSLVAWLMLGAVGACVTMWRRVRS